MSVADLRPGDLDIRVRRGDSILLPVTVKEDGVAVNVSARTFRAQVRKKADGEVVTNLGIDMANAATGVVRIRVNAAGMSGTYSWDFEDVTNSRTLLAGRFVVDADVSR